MMMPDDRALYGDEDAFASRAYARASVPEFDLDGMDRSETQRGKRTLDLAVALAVLIVALPLMALIAAAIAAESGFPVFFRQERHGRNGRPFAIYKFRTMRANGRDGSQAVRGDPRVTTVGQFLRRSSLDELPQIINVLAGEMSLVGPRPHPVWLDTRYAEEIRGYTVRFKVRPGITGLAQVNGARGETRTAADMVRRIQWDRQYVEQWSIGLDLKILALTATRIWFDDAAY
jgi:putative colanic acid biosynthesis UDP-glucose lipid carrier transferase